MSARAASALLVLTAACAVEPFVGVEPWTRAPEIRVALVLREGSTQVFALDARTPIEAVIDSDEDAELVVYAYDADTFRAAFAGLAEVPTADLIARLSPVPGTTGEPLPPAAEVLVASVGARGARPLSYERLTWTQWAARKTAAAELRLALPTDVVCGRTRVTTATVPADVDVEGLVAVGQDRVVLMGRARSGTDRDVRVSLYTSGRVAPLATLATASAPTSGDPAWDPLTSTVWDVDGGGRLFRVDLMGREQVAPDAPDATTFPGTRARARRVAAGRDGTVLASFDYEYLEMGQSRVGQNLYTYADNRWTVTQLADGAYRFFDVVSTRRMAAYYRCWIYQYPGATDAEWWQAVLDPPCVSAGRTLLLDVDLDSSGGVIVGREGQVHVRDEALDKWVAAGATLPMADYVVGAAAGGGRAVIAQSTGQVYHWRGDRWCPTEVATGVVYDAISGAPEGGVVYLLPTTHDRVIRLELP